MVLVILPALIPDIRKVYAAYFESFKNDVMGQLMVQMLFPGGLTETQEFRESHAEGTLAYWHKSEVQYTFKVVDTDTAEIVGIALGDIYLRERSDDERKWEGVPWLEGEARERAEKVLKPLWEAREKLFGGRPYIYVHVIGVDPKHQGRRAGALMVEWGLDLSNRTNLPIYGEASPTTVAMYEKLGYQRLDETIVHSKETLGLKEDVVVPLMVRMPAGAGGLTFNEWRAKGYPKF